MYIKNINIKNFGKISDFNISPQNGLNVIYASNERGKTTLASFVKYMFYGLKIKKKPGDISFKERYTPWNGMPICGSIELEDRDRLYTIQRSDYGGKSTLSVVDNDNIISMHNVKNPGIYFMGLGEQAFDDSVFCTDTLSICNNTTDAEIVLKLLNSSNSHNVYNNAYSKLNESLQSLISLKRSNSTLSRLNAEIDEYRKKISSIELKIAEVKKVLSEFDLKYEKIENLIKENEDLSYELKKNEHDDLTNELVHLTNKKKELMHNFDKMCNSPTLDKSMEFEMHTLKEESDEINVNITKNKSKLLFSIFSLILSLLLNLYMLLMNGDNIFIIMAFVLVLISLFFICTGTITYKQLLQKHRCNKNKKDALNKRFNQLKQSEYTILSLSHNQTYTNDSAFKSFLENEITSINKSIKKCKAKLTSLDFHPDNKNRVIKNFTNQKINDIMYNNNIAIADIKAKINNMQHFRTQYIKLKSEHHNINDEIDRLEKEKINVADRAEIISIAIDILEKSFSELKDNVFPRICENTLDNFKLITGDEYTSLIIDNKFDISYKCDGFVRKSSTLSKGAIDALYISLRLSILDYMCDNENSIPLLLDDCLSNCDDERAWNLLDIIYKASKKHQIFLMTCRRRESEYFIGKSDVKIFEI